MTSRGQDRIVALEMETVHINFNGTLPSKVYFKIGEVAQLAGVETYILRYWESEFGFKLNKSKHGQRLYQKKDVLRLLLIKQLLYGEKYTIAGAKKKLREIKKLEKEKQLSLIYEQEPEKGSPPAPDIKNNPVKPIASSENHEKIKTRLQAIKLKLEGLLQELQS